MDKRLEIIKKTKSSHNCVACRRRIKQGVPAMALVIKDENGKLILYFCGHECYDYYEETIMSITEEN